MILYIHKKINFSYLHKVANNFKYAEKKKIFYLKWLIICYIDTKIHKLLLIIFGYFLQLKITCSFFRVINSINNIK